jgi:hypothetical protein
LENKVVEEGLDGGMLNKFLKNDHWEKSADILKIEPYFLVKLQSAWESRDIDNLDKVSQQKAFQQKWSTANESSGDNDESNVDDKKDDLQYTGIHRSDDAVPSPSSPLQSPPQSHLKKLAETAIETETTVAETTTDNPELVAAEVHTRDDKSGKDHVGYLTYALVLAILVHKGVQPPCVFGLYAAWGTGKSFIMEKTIAAIQMVRTCPTTSPLPPSLHNSYYQILSTTTTNTNTNTTTPSHHCILAVVTRRDRPICRERVQSWHERV